MSSSGISVGYQVIVLQLVEVKGVPINCKIVLDILEGQTLQRWGFDGRQQQKQKQAQAAAKAVGSSKPQQEHKQHSTNSNQKK